MRNEHQWHYQDAINELGYIRRHSIITRHALPYLCGTLVTSTASPSTTIADADHIADHHSVNDAASERNPLFGNTVDRVFFLLLATVSPFLGASFLRYILTLIAGEDILTWFSTGLILLATGIRPWTHVVERLTLRILHLHDVIHYPSPEQTTEDLRQQLTDLKGQIEKMEHTLGKVRQRMDDGAEATYEYVDEAVEVVKRACGGMRRSATSRIRE
ncbi:hypothetical protein IW262DRAFT_1074944 [Armillaria fumosa]|nr:hypothetical protein IW262DRAFT_1074944 [Armillaria fumosa]